MGPSPEVQRALMRVRQSWAERNAHWLAFGAGVLGAYVVFRMTGRGRLSKNASVEDLPPVRSMRTHSVKEAVQTGSLPVVEMLLRSGAYADGDALEAAVDMERLDLVEALLKHGVDVHADEDLALVVAAHFGQIISQLPT